MFILQSMHALTGGNTQQISKIGFVWLQPYYMTSYKAFAFMSREDQTLFEDKFILLSFFPIFAHKQKHTHDPPLGLALY